MTRTPDTFELMQGRDDRSGAKTRGVSVRSDLIDLTLVLHHTTERAILVSDDGKKDGARWLPRSKVEYRFTGRLTEGERYDGRMVEMEVIEVALPEWLAEQKGLV